MVFHGEPLTKNNVKILLLRFFRSGFWRLKSVLQAQTAASASKKRNNRMHFTTVIQYTRRELRIIVPVYLRDQLSVPYVKLT